jgi:subtilisin family serine protease
MVLRCFAILAVALMAISILPPGTALPDLLAEVDGEDPVTPGPWWSDWPSDMDRDGVHDWLEDLAEEAMAEDPNARLDVVVDLDRVPTAVDVERLERLGLEVQHVSHYVNAVLGSLPVSAIEAARALPGVVMLEAQGKGFSTVASAGESISLPRVHDDMGFDGTGTTIAVLDTGVNADHVALDDLDDDPNTDDPKLVAFFDAYSNTTKTAYDQGEHGTWVAGIATGTGGGTSPNVGIAPGAKLVGVRIGSSGGFPESKALLGLEWVIANKETYNISVAVCSWGITLGGPNDHNGNSAISRAADRAVEAGISVVVSAGNSALSATVTAPGDARLVVTVGSVNDNHFLSSFSSEGPTTDGRTKPDVCAPGEDITGAWSQNNNGYFTGDGTSASAPIVGGLMALMLEANPFLTPAQVKQILHETSEHNTARQAKYLFTPNNGYGWGVVHAPGAVSRAADLRPPSLDIPVSVDSGEDLSLEVVGTYTRTPHTELGENGQNRLGEDEITVEATVPDDWERPRATYVMEGDIIAAPVAEPIAEEDGVFKMRVTFRVLTDVNALTVGYPTIRFTTTAPVTSQAETYTFTTKEIMNNMEGEEGRIRVSVGGNVQPEIEITSPNGGADVADTFYVIRWTDDDPDDNARITLYNDMDTDPASGRVLIVSNLAEDPEGDGDSYLWDTTTLVEGRAFYVQAVIDDGTNEPMSVYSSGTVTIKHTGGNSPPSVEIVDPDGDNDVADDAYSIEYLAYDPDDIASVSLYWDTDATGFDGNTIVRDLEEDDGFGSYTWDTSALEDGLVAYVYAIVSDGQNPQARAYGAGPVTIDHDAGPSIVDYGPTGAGVPLDTPVRVTFDKEMDRTSVESATSVTPNIAGTYSWTGNEVRFTPGGGWDGDTTYTATVSTDALDVGGNPLGTEKEWSFRTEESPTPTDPPVLTITSPGEGDTVSGLVWVEGTGARVGAEGVVEVRIDGGDWISAEGTTSWRIAWDTEAVLDGDHTISAAGTDGNGRTGPVVTVNVTVRNAASSPPVVEAVKDREVEVDQQVSFTVEANDPDGDTLAFSDDTPLFDINPSSGKVSFVPSDLEVGTWHIEVTVSDGTHQTKATFIITVQPKSDDESILGFIPLTMTQLLGVVVLLFIVIVGIAVYARSRGSRGSRGEVS